MSAVTETTHGALSVVLQHVKPSGVFHLVKYISKQLVQNILLMKYGLNCNVFALLIFFSSEIANEFVLQSATLNEI